MLDSMNRELQAEKEESMDINRTHDAHLNHQRLKMEHLEKDLLTLTDQLEMQQEEKQKAESILELFTEKQKHQEEQFRVSQDGLGR